MEVNSGNSSSSLTLMYSESEKQSHVYRDKSDCSEGAVLIMRSFQIINVRLFWTYKMVPKCRKECSVEKKI